MSEISNLGYAIIGISDKPRWVELATLLGFQVDELDGDVLALRMDELAQRLVLEPGQDDDLRAMGWEFDSQRELGEYVQRLRAMGVEVSPGDAGLATQRRVESLWSCRDPSGVAHEFYVGAARADVPFSSSGLSGGGFVTGQLGFGHILLRTDDCQGAAAFCRDVLGLHLSDRIVEEVAPGLTVDATFFHSRTGRHHSLAVATMPGTRKIGHLMVEVQSMDDVGVAHERCAAAGIPIRATLGRHPNDMMFSFYLETPSGFSLEYGWGGIVIEAPDWESTTYDRLSLWGHRRQMGPPPPQTSPPGSA